MYTSRQSAVYLASAALQAHTDHASVITMWLLDHTILQLSWLLSRVSDIIRGKCRCVP